MPQRILCRDIVFRSKEGIAVQRPWWKPACTFAQQALVNSACLVLLVLAAVYGSSLISFSSHAIASKFSFHVLVILEYAVVVGDAIVILINVIEHVWRALKRAMK